MQIYTLASLRDELKEQLGKRTDVLDSRYNRWLNEAVVAMADELEFPDTLTSASISTASNQEFYVLADGINTILSASLADNSDSFYGGYPLWEMDLDWYRQQAAVTGKPTHWMIYNRYLVLWPKPDNAYTVVLDTDNVSGEMLLDTDVVPFRPSVSGLVLLRARWIANDALGQPEAAALAQNAYITQLRMRADHLAKQQVGRTLKSSVPRTERQLRLGARGYPGNAILKSS